MLKFPKQFIISDKKKSHKRNLLEKGMICKFRLTIANFSLYRRLRVNLGVDSICGSGEFLDVFS